MSQTTVFASPLLNEENLIAASGGGISCAERVLAGSKPIGFVDAREGSELAELVERAHAGGLSLRSETWESRDGYSRHVFLSIARPGYIDRTFDLEALEAAYLDRFAGDSEAAASIEDSIKTLSNRSLADYLAFRDLEVDISAIWDGRVHPAGEYLRTGLLLGYPPESTFAVIESSLEKWYRRSQ